MLKRITLLARRDDLTFDEFSKHWLTTHGDIVKNMPMVHGYIQNPIDERLLKSLNPTDPFSFDGIVELWFADQEAQGVAFASEAAAMLPVDEKNFIRGITIFPVTEECQDNTYPVKVMMAVRFGGDDVDIEQAAKSLAQEVSDLPDVCLVAVNHLGEVGWREDLWHEPHPPHALIELGFDRPAMLDGFAKQAGLAALHSSVTKAGGALECYKVEARRII